MRSDASEAGAADAERYAANIDIAVFATYRLYE